MQEAIKPFIKIDPDLAFYGKNPIAKLYHPTISLMQRKRMLSLLPKVFVVKLGGVMKEDYNGGVGFGENGSRYQIHEQQGIFQRKAENIEELQITRCTPKWRSLYLKYME